MTNITENVYTLPGVCSSTFHITEEGIFVFPSVTGGDQTNLCSQEIQINLMVFLSGGCSSPQGWMENVLQSCPGG